MNRFVLDASVALSWCFEDETNSDAERVLDSLAEWIALVPPVWSLEVMNGLLSAERRKRIPILRVNECIDAIRGLPIIADAEADEGEIPRLARRTDLSAYDASYVELAARHALPIATRDRALRLAARKLGLAIFAGTS